MSGAGYLSCGLKATKEANVSVHSLDHVLIKAHVYKRASAMRKLLKAVATAATNKPTAINEPTAICKVLIPKTSFLILLLYFSYKSLFT